jgi:NTE family protein
MDMDNPSTGARPSAEFGPRRHWDAVDLPAHGAQGRVYRTKNHYVPRRDKVAFVLTGGGALGAVQVGMLRALVEHDIRADVVLGSSVGALNAAGYAQNPTHDGIDIVQRAWMDAQGNDLFNHGRLWSLKQFATKRNAVYEVNGLATLIDQVVVHERIEEFQVPFGVMATSLTGDPERCFWVGPARDLLLASSALPGVFPSVMIGNQRFIDGGVINNMPVVHAVAAGATKIYVLLCGPQMAETETFGPRPIDHVIGAFALARKARAWHDLDSLSTDIEVMVIPGPSAAKLYYVDLSHTSELIERGRAVAHAFLNVTEQHASRESVAVGH